MAYIAGTVLDDTGAAVGGRTVRAYRRDTGALLGSTTSASSAVTGDSNLGSVVLLLNGAGTNGSTTITDTSPTPKTITAVGNAQISTAQSKYGGSSMSFDGTGDYLDCTPTSAFTLGTGSFTIEFWVYHNTNPFLGGGTGRHNYFTTEGTDGWDYWDGGGLTIYNTSSTVVFEARGANIFSAQTPQYPFSSGEWVHMAFVRSGSSVKIFVNGACVATATSDVVNAINTAAKATHIGGGGRTALFGSNSMNGYIDDFRFTIGVARYTADFTPPSSAFPTVAYSLQVGGYRIDNAYTGDVNVVCLDDSGGTTHNDRILRTTPV